MNEEDLISGCLKHERASQRALYEIYFSKMMHVCIRYAKNQQEAKNILLDGFKNIFNNLRIFSDANAKRKKDAPSVSLEEWIKKEIVASAIRHIHNNKREYFVSSTVSVRDSEKQFSTELSD
ncbi:MAG: hypothetical protein AABZ32_06885, partial [Bacteroidota bacterium]